MQSVEIFIGAIVASSTACSPKKYEDSCHVKAIHDNNQWLIPPHRIAFRCMKFRASFIRSTVYIVIFYTNLKTSESPVTPRLLPSMKRNIKRTDWSFNDLSR